MLMLVRQAYRNEVEEGPVEEAEAATEGLTH